MGALSVMVQLPFLFLALVCLQRGNAVRQLAEWPDFSSMVSSSSSVNPPCGPKTYTLAEVAKKSAEWCNPNLVPEGQRAPKKIAGLYWLKGLEELEDVLACTSAGTWDQNTLSLDVSVWDNFMFKEGALSVAFASGLYQAGMVYTFKFSSEDLSDAIITPKGTTQLGMAPLKLFGMIADFKMTDISPKGASPGDLWDRPSAFGLGDTKVKVHQYQLVKVLNADLQVLEGQNAEMQVGLGKDLGGAGIIRFPHQVDGRCQAP